MAKIGYEVEGRYQGLRTLFVNSLELKKIKVVPTNIQQIYVSDLENTLDLMTDETLVGFGEKYFVTVERTKAPWEIHHNVNVMLNLQVESFWHLRNTDQIKFHLDTNKGPTVKSVSVGEMYHTSPVDFLDDKEIDLE